MIEITKPEQFTKTYQTIRVEFDEQGLSDAFDRVIAVVVQPGVEFSDSTVTKYRRRLAKPLCDELKQHPGVVFEGHSTEYQKTQRLKEMVQDGIAILKVGPALTFSLRDALFRLADIEEQCASDGMLTNCDTSRLKHVLVEVMNEDPTYWKGHSPGVKKASVKLLERSLSDRCRYYLSRQEIVEAIARLENNLDSIEIPHSLLEKYLPEQSERVSMGILSTASRELIKDFIKDRIFTYIQATDPMIATADE
jgi:D-tagatose-1,6-bisphosphate aldolase subunit GatZ/KbaZ